MYIESGDREICVLMRILYMNTYTVNFAFVCTCVCMYVNVMYVCMYVCMYACTQQVAPLLTGVKRGGLAGA